MPTLCVVSQAGNSGATLAGARSGATDYDTCSPDGSLGDPAEILVHDAELDGGVDASALRRHLSNKHLNGDWCARLPERIPAELAVWCPCRGRERWFDDRRRKLESYKTFFSVALCACRDGKGAGMFTGARDSAQGSAPGAPHPRRELLHAQSMGSMSRGSGAHSIASGGATEGKSFYEERTVRPGGVVSRRHR